MVFIIKKRIINIIEYVAGSYTDSPGIEIVRRHVAEFIQRRDEIATHFDNIILSDGASNAIKVSANIS